MRLKTLKSALLIVFFLCMVAVIGVLWINSEVADLADEHANLSQQTKAINLLKGRWSLQESQSDVEYFKNRPNLIKQEKRGGNMYLEYDNLSASEFNLLSNRMLNAMLVIKKLTFRHDSSGRGVIIVEIES